MDIFFHNNLVEASAYQMPGDHLGFQISPKKQRDVEHLLPFKFRLNPFSNLRGEVENVSANKTPDGHLGFLIGRKTQPQ